MYKSMEVTTKNSFLRKVFFQMFLGVLITGIMSIYSLESRPLLTFVMEKFTFIVIAQLTLVVILSFCINRISTFTALSMFLIYSLLNGAILSGVMYMYTFSSIIYALIGTLVIFISMSLYGIFTKEDLAKYSTFFRVGLISLIIVSCINIFLKSSLVGWGISVVSVVIFTGLIAFDINRIINIFEDNFLEEKDVNKLAVIGALTLYLDFINLFLNLLRLFGNRRD